MEPFYATSCRVYSHKPEHDAFEMMRRWAKKNGFLSDKPNYRIFGYDVPDSYQEDGTYGYEVLLTIPEEFEIHDEYVMKKQFSGGLYAVTSTNVGVITNTWEKFNKWLKMSKYSLGGHQCLEEHSAVGGFQERPINKEDEIEVDLYMPITKRKDTEL